MAPPQHLPRWFLAAAVGSVAFTLVWMIGLVALQHSPQLATKLPTDSSLYLYAGVLNSLLGSFLSASGYCCQKFAHVRVQRDAALGTASQQPLFIFGLFLLAVGTVSAVLNLGILGQAVQAPFAALTLIYSALLGHFVLRERVALFDFASSVLIVAGVAVDVFAAQLAEVPQQTYTLASLGALLFRDSLFQLAYTVLTLSYVALLLRRVRRQNLHHRAVGLLAFSSSAGIMAGFTSLATKSAVEVVKAALRTHRTYDLVNPFFVLIIIGIPCALVPQLFFLNKGLEFFGTLKFIPLYQAFIILGNMGCGMIFYNEMDAYEPLALLAFLVGIAVTLGGVCLLLAKVQESEPGTVTERQPLLPVTTTPTTVVDQFVTQFALSDMEFATDVETLSDFDACKRRIVTLLQSTSKSVYYSTFLCDFGQELVAPDVTVLSLLHDAVARGVCVSILYNPVVDYGTASLARLKAQLPRGVTLVCRVSDLGPSPITQLLSNNSKYAFHHQKYLCIDDEVVMVTGCDVNSERAGWRRPNALGYYWHELSVVAKCSPKMAHWIQLNHAADVSKKHYDQFHDAPPFPLVAGGWREENAMVNLILHAKHSIQLENQILISGGSAQHNRICDAIAARVSRAHTHGETFHVLLLTNAAQQDEPSLVTRWYCTISIQWSLEALQSAALARGLSQDDLEKYVLVARLEADGVLVKVHSNILIMDGQYALRSSSNLADRSLSARPTDTELGLFFSGAAVAALQQKLLRMYYDENVGAQHYSLAQIFDRVRREGRSGCIVPLSKRGWSPVVTWFLMYLFVYGSEGATGGRVKVTYTTTREVIGTPAASY